MMVTPWAPSQSARSRRSRVMVAKVLTFFATFPSGVAPGGRHSGWNRKSDPLVFRFRRQDFRIVGILGREWGAVLAAPCPPGPIVHVDVNGDRLDRKMDRHGQRRLPVDQPVVAAVE